MKQLSYTSMDLSQPELVELRKKLEELKVSVEKAYQEAKLKEQMKH